MTLYGEAGQQIEKDYVDDRSYFIINKGRQYGKTTMLMALEDYLKEDYIVLSLDGESASDCADE